MDAADEPDLVQDITPDCSVVASLCAALRHMGSQKTSLLSRVMYPFDAHKGRPAISANGKYMFRMHFNGCFRQVVVDDRLPASSTSRTLFVVDRRNPQLIWPALLEKAYLKVRGGYDFPGSNSGTDLWILTGWIPEQIFLQSDDIELDQAWNRIRKSYEYGDVVVTLGTGRLSPEEEEALGLAGEHDYAMLGLKVDNGARKMLLKNPWCDGLVWRGVGSSSLLDIDAATTGLEHLAITSEQSLTGSFWIAFEDVVQNFESLYLNWNPALFTHRQDHHFTWTLPPKAMALSLAYNPQFSLSPSADGQVWILVSRHFQDGELAFARARSPPSSTLAALSSSLGFMSLHVFASRGRRVQLSDRPASIHAGPYVDSPQTMLRFDARAGETYTVAVAQSGLPLLSYSFTLSLFSRAPLAVAPAKDELRHYTELAGAWNRRSAGGSSACPTFVRNPQYLLRLPAASPVTLLLCAADDSIPVRVDLVWAAARVTALTTRDVAATSGAYARGRTLAAVTPASPQAGATTLPAGSYVVVLSTYEPGQLAEYTLRAGADVPLDIAPLPPAGAGLLRTALPPLPTPPSSSASSPASSASSTSGTAHRLRLFPPRLSRIAAEATRVAGADGSAAARLSLALGAGAHRRVLAVSDAGEFADPARVAAVDVDPGEAAREGGLWVVAETVGRWRGEVELLSEYGIEVGGGWEVDE
jgi:calpain-7